MLQRSIVTALGLFAVLGLVVACDDSSSSSSSSSSSGGSSSGGTTDPSDPTPDELAKRGNCPAVPAGTAGTKHTDRISADETWKAADSPHRVGVGVLRVMATVTIEPCAVVLLDKGAYIQIGGNSASEVGKLVAKGTSSLSGGTKDVRPVVFDASDASAPWSQISVEQKGTLELSVAAIMNGGAEVSGEQGALRMSGAAGGTNFAPVTRNATVDRVLVEKSQTYGINLDGWGAFAEGSQKVWIRGSGSAKYPYPIRIEPGVAKTLPPGLTTSGNVKEEILVLTSKTFMVDDTYVNRGLPYHQLGLLYVGPGEANGTATLTIEPGVTVAFEERAGSGIRIGSQPTQTGSLVAVGTAEKPITFTSGKDTKAAGDWVSLYFKSPTASGSKISYAKVEYAGARSGSNGFGCGPGANDAAIFIGGVGKDDAAPSIIVDHTTFDNIGGTTVIVSGWVDDTGPNNSPTNTFGASTPSCKVSKPRRSGAGDVCDGGRTTCWN